MRSQLLVWRSRSLLQASATPFYSTARHTRPGRPRKEQTSIRSNVRLNKRLASTTLASSADPEAPPPDNSESQTDGAVEKPKRIRKSNKDSEAPPQFPPGLDILWTPESDPAIDPRPLQPSILPPLEIFEEALNNLHITLHPQTQHRATYTTPAGPPSEPTLALYCPIEGGDYIIDETVRELARRTNAEVIVLDSVQLAAGEWGHFGKAANTLQLPTNPLHFRPYSQASQLTTRGEHGDVDTSFQMPSPSQMTLTLMGNVVGDMRAGSVINVSPRSSAPSKIKIFFDELVNIPATQAESLRKPRIIYIRDFSTLAPTSSTWYPPLLSAVRQRRKGAMSRPASPISNPMTIVFGITPSITAPALSDPSSYSGQGSALTNFLLTRPQSPSVGHPSPRPSKTDWSEDEVSERAREKRLRDRLRKWGKGDAAIQDELPILHTNNDVVEDGGGNTQRPEIVILGGPGSGSSAISGLPPQIRSIFAARALGNRGGSEPEGPSRFFRTSVLVPSVRSVVQERACRVSRRREINELTIRMGIGAIGGILGKRDEPAEVLNAEPEGDGVQGKSTENSSRSEEDQMWDDWGGRVEVWSNVRQIADRAVGSVVATWPSAPLDSKTELSTLDSTVIPWSALRKAWAIQRSSRDLRKAWMKECSGKVAQEREDEDEDVEDVEEQVDEVVERLKEDPDLDQHEQQLLPCIVDPASIPTSFSQVHLPPHTIDSVRTIVSLPLLHPAAFQQGILKEHGMTGCLLFGPPGTGKTLVVRALAKEAGCRMMTISPSDVMDMYVGEGEKLVKAVFSLARKLAPCVVFLDEIDALFGARMSAHESGGAFAHRGVITEFMQEMDGLKSSKHDNVIVIGATNRPFDLDDAVLRRLPRRLLVDLPGEKEREEILKILLHDETLSPNVNLHALAKQTEMFSGSDLKHFCVSAALDAVKERVDVPWGYPSVGPLMLAVGSEEDSLETVTSPSTSRSIASDSSSCQTLAPSPSSPSQTDDVASFSVPTPHQRILYPRHFTKALKEITPSSSESLGSLADLRRWNEEFGEGQKSRKKQVWGKGMFGFTDKGNKVGEEGRVGALMSTIIGPGVQVEQWSREE